MNTLLLANQNPWWVHEEFMNEDTHLRKIRSRSYYFEFPIKQELELAPGAFHILRGPRQVGKTTLIKEWIERLILEKKAPGKNICYLSCEAIADYKELHDILMGIFPKPVRQPHFLFLDEISFVAEWQRAVLAFVNMGLLDHVCLVVTGSNAKDLKLSSERFPGRRGKGRDVSLFPLAPEQYRSLTCFRELSDPEILECYFRVGGFPHAIRDYVEFGNVSDETYQTYRNWIIGDAARFDLGEEFLKHILFRIKETFGGRITWPTLIEHTHIKRHETALAYVEHIQDSFLGKIHYCYDPDIRGPAFSKARKLFLIDPLLYYVAEEWKTGLTNIWSWVLKTVEDPSFKGRLLESTYVNSVSRMMPRTYYWYSAKEKKEVDLVLDERKAIRLFDVKLGKPETYRAFNHEVRSVGPGDYFDFVKALA